MNKSLFDLTIMKKQIKKQDLEKKFLHFGFFCILPTDDADIVMSRYCKWIESSRLHCKIFVIKKNVKVRRNMPVLKSTLATILAMEFMEN